MTTTANRASTLHAEKNRITGFWPVLLGLVLVVGFFVAHQVWSTGFFTSDFGLLGTFLFYCALGFGFTFALGVPVALSRRFGRRTELTYELATALFWTITAAWLLLVFPLNFSQLNAVVPGQLKFVLSWITNDVGRILLGTALVGALAFIPFYAIQFRTTGQKRNISRPA